MRSESRTLGIIGAGSRARVIYRNLQRFTRLRVSIDRVFDVDRSASSSFVERHGHADTVVCSSYEQVIEARPDVVIIASMNSAHAEPALLCIRSGIPLYLEKPLASTWEDTRRLIEAWREHRTPVVVGFVLRYTDFYQEVMALCESGAVGRIASLHAEENFGPKLVNLFLRGWRRYRKLAGPVLLEKCCHDLDLFNWLAASRPLRVTSLGARTLFNPRSDLPQRCRECHIYDQCPYSFDYSEGSKRYRDDGVREYADNLADLCVWNSEKDILDHQSVVIEYENGALATFTLNMSAEATRRIIRIAGTKGRIEGDLHSGRLAYYPLDGSKPTCRTVHSANTSGHHGGDQGIAAELEQVLNDPDRFVPKSSIEEGGLASLVAFAADRSVQERRTVECAELLS